MQAEVLTFQKLSFNNSINLDIIFLLGYSQIFDRAQQAILLFLESEFHKHFWMSEIDSKAYGRPINPKEFNPASTIYGFLWVSDLFKTFIT